MKMQDRVKLVVQLLEVMIQNDMAVYLCSACGAVNIWTWSKACSCKDMPTRLNLEKFKRALLHGLDNYKALEADRLEAIDLGMAAVQSRDLAMAMASEELDRRTELANQQIRQSLYDLAIAKAELADKDRQIEALTQQVAKLSN